MREAIDEYLRGDYSDVEMILFGPFEAPVYKIEEKYRMRIVIKCRLNKRSREMLSMLLADFGRNTKGNTAISINLNPTGL